MATKTMTKTDEIKAEIRRNVEIKSPSKKLRALLDSLKLDFRKLQKRIDEIFRVAREEDFPDFETGKMIRMRMEGEYSETTIRRVLPKTAKLTTIAKDNKGGKQDITSDKAFKMNASIHEKQDTYVSNATNEDTPEANQKKAQLEMETGEQEPGASPAISKTDPYQTFREVIEAKNKLIKEKDEEIKGLKKQLQEANKKVARLEAELKKVKK